MSRTTSSKREEEEEEENYANAFAKVIRALFTVFGVVLFLPLPFPAKK